MGRRVVNKKKNTADAVNHAVRNNRYRRSKKENKEVRPGMFNLYEKDWATGWKN